MIIDFKSISNQYNKNLTDKLRGFGEEEYLKFWVPDTEKNKSILNLIDALFESNTLEAKIKNVDLNENDMSFFLDLREIAIKDIKKDEIVVLIDYKKYQDFKVKNRKKVNVKIKSSDHAIQSLEKLNQELKINPFYEDVIKKLNSVIKNQYNEDNLKKNLEQIKVKLSENVCLYLFVENQNVIDILIKSKNNDNLTKALDLFCTISKNKPFQEIAEHGAIYLEYELRKHSEKPSLKSNVNGIFLPSNSGGLFNLLNLKLREVYEDYINKNNIKPELNKSYYAPNPNWIKLNFKEQKSLVNNILNKNIFRQHNISEEDISLNRVIQNNRLEFNLSNRLKGDFEEKILFEIEDVLKKEIDNSIELLTLEEEDSNILRLSNAPKSV